MKLNLLNQLKSDMLKLIELSKDIGKYNEMLLHHIEASDERNFNEEKAKLIKQRISELAEKYFLLKDKWFNYNE